MATSPRPRIAVVSPFIDKKHATERATAEFLSRLKNNFEFHLYSSRVEGLDPGTVIWHRVPALPGPHLLGYLWWFAANHIQRWWDRTVRGLKPALVYSPGINCMDADAIAVHVIFTRVRQHLKEELKLPGNRLSAWPRTIHRRIYYRLIEALERRVYRRRDVALAAVSQKAAKDIVRYFSPPNDVAVIYYGLDLEQFSPKRRAALRGSARTALNLDASDFALLLIGNDWKGKGLPCLLEAVRMANEPCIRILVAGSDNPAAFEAAIAKAGLTARLQFLPIRQDVEFYYAAADAYVGPSLEDTFAMPVAESMACGLPVITSRGAGVSELITPRCDGLVLENPTDAVTLASMIGQLVHEPGFRCRLAKEAAKTAQQCSWERNAQQTWELFERALRLKNS